MLELFELLKGMEWNGGTVDGKACCPSCFADRYPYTRGGLDAEPAHSPGCKLEAELLRPRAANSSELALETLAANLRAVLSDLENRPIRQAISRIKRRLEIAEEMLKRNGPVDGFKAEALREGA